MALRVAVNGLGRIGRLVIRALLERDTKDIELVAINGTRAIAEHVHLLKYDSSHGTYKGEIIAHEDAISFTSSTGKTIANAAFSAEKDPTKLNWKDLGVDLVFECSGKFNSKEKASAHIQAGAKRVIVSAPCENADNTIVFGVNHKTINKDQQVISIGSCTTNALAPIAKILNDEIGIEKGFMTTIHSYTNDQNILDGSHKDLRRARSCAMSIIPTSTGAAKALGLVLPELAGKLDGSAARVPVPNVSMVDLKFLAKRNVTKDEIIKLITEKAAGEYKNIVAVAEAPLVSIDFNGNPHSSIFDPYETYVVGGNFVRVVSWYDNEWGFSERMVDVALLCL